MSAAVAAHPEAVSVRRPLWQRLFVRADEKSPGLGIEMNAGLVMFLASCYIIPVNAGIVSGAKPGHGTPFAFAGVATATCLVAGVMCLFMAVVAKRMFLIAPGMGLNAVVAYSLITNNKLSMGEGMGLVVLEGAVLVLLVVTTLREKVFDAVPIEMKKAIAVGIGLFILFIGLEGGGIIVKDPNTLVTFGPISWYTSAAWFGLILAVVLTARVGGKKRYHLLGTILATTVYAVIVNHYTHHKAFGTQTAMWPGWHHLVATPDFSTVGVVSFHAFSSSSMGFVNAAVWVFALSLSDMFDFTGTTYGVGKIAGYLKKDGSFRGLFRTLLADALAAVAGGGSGVSSATSYVETTTGAESGGRTGVPAATAGALFLICMFLAPIAGIVPAPATTAALVMVGIIILGKTLVEPEEDGEDTEGMSLKAKKSRMRFRPGINFSDPRFMIPVALTMVFTPLSYSITTGIGMGFISYMLIVFVRREWERLNLFMLASTLAFVFYFLVPPLRARGWL